MNILNQKNAFTITDYLSELMMCFNFLFNEMCHGTGSAAGCDFNNEEE